MFNLLRARIRHGFQGVPNVTSATLDPRFRGLPTVSDASPDEAVVERLKRACPSDAIAAPPLRIDLGRCHFCGECARDGGPISFTNRHYLGASSREALIVDAQTTAASYEERAFKVRNAVHRMFGRSFKLRSVSAAGCNACESELNATTNVNFDMQRYGFDIVASPRHADGVILTGPISENMAAALEDTWKATPDPKVLVLMGACAISGGVFAQSQALDRSFLDGHTADIFIPGCPPHPLTIINSLLNYLGVRV